MRCSFVKVHPLTVETLSSLIEETIKSNILGQLPTLPLLAVIKGCYWILLDPIESKKKEDIFGSWVKKHNKNKDKQAKNSKT